MSGRDGLMDASPDAGLAAALRALPESAPEPDLWPELARALEKRRRPRVWRYAIPVALAAGLALALLVPRTPPHTSDVPLAANPPPGAAQTASTAASNTNEMDRLHERSDTLERWIAAVAARAPQDGRDLMAAVEVEDLIGLVDVQLTAAHGKADALPLWRQRVALLEDLAVIRSNAFALAGNGDSGAVPASLNLIN